MFSSTCHVIAVHELLLLKESLPLCIDRIDRIIHTYTHTTYIPLLTNHCCCLFRCRMHDHEFKFYCPILMRIFEEPVKAEDGRTYDREGIEAWFETCRVKNEPITSPWTRERMGQVLRPDWEAAESAEKVRAEAVRNLPSINDLRKVFAILDPLRDILNQSLNGWQPPQLVAIGDESSGKSSVLERLAMMPIFPYNHRMCTRLPIHVRLRNTHKCMPATLAVFNTRTNTPEGQAQVIPMEYGVVDVREKMQEIIEREHGNASRAVSTDCIIILTIQSPHVPTIDLIDMPGFVSTPDALRNNTRQLVESHIQSHGKYSLFLTVVRATVAPNTSFAMEIVQKHKLQDRTIGVFSMCDRAMDDPESSEEFLERLQHHPESGAVELKPHGWVCVMNRKPEAKDDAGGSTCANFARLRRQALAEDEFMCKKIPAGTVQEGRTGCRALIDRLSRQFLQFVKQDWGPKTIMLLNQALDDAHIEMYVLGTPAFDKLGSEHATQARQRAVIDARQRLEVVQEGHMQGYCEKYLAPLRDELVKITSPVCFDYPASTFQALQNQQRTIFATKCKRAVSEWAAYWALALRTELQFTVAVPRTRLERFSMLASPPFQLGRFSTYTSVIEHHFAALIASSQKDMEAEVDSLIAKYYDKMSPWVTVKPMLQGNAPKVRVTCNSEPFIDSIVMCFIEGRTEATIAKLASCLTELAAKIPDSDWVESCVDKRRDVPERIKALSDARQKIQDMLGLQADNVTVPVAHSMAGIVEGQCSYIKVGNLKSAGIAVNQQGHILVAEQTNNAVHVFSGEGSHGKLLSSFVYEKNSRGYMPATIQTGLVVDKDRNICVCNTSHKAICVVKFDGKFVRHVKLGNPHFDERVPRAIAIDQDDTLYVLSEKDKSQQHVFTNPHQGLTLDILTVKGENLQTFKIDVRIQQNLNGSMYMCQNSVSLLCPVGLAVDANKIIYVTDPERHLIKAYDVKGTHIRDIGAGLLRSPNAIAVDLDGLLYVVSHSVPGVVVLERNGNKVKTIPTEAGCHYVTVDSKGQVLVSQADRICIVRA